MGHYIFISGTNHPSFMVMIHASGVPMEFYWSPDGVVRHRALNVIYDMNVKNARMASPTKNRDPSFFRIEYVHKTLAWLRPSRLAWSSILGFLWLFMSRY